MSDPQHSASDVAATKTVHPALVNQMAMFETVFDRAPVGLAVLDRDFRYRMVNAVLAEINGLAAAEHIGRTPQEIAPQLWPYFAAAYEDVLRGETLANRPISGVITKHGIDETRHWMASCYPVRDGDEIIGIGIAVSDITELQRFRDALRIRTDLYAMISRTSRAAVERQSRQELFNDICRIATETGNFRFAWIGVPDGDRVRPVAQAGKDNDYMAELVVALDDADPRSHGPGGTAVRTGRSSVVNDFIRDPGTRPWHALASRAGFASLAALPFLERGKVVAVLMLSANDIDFFTDELTATLDEIGPIVSFALEALAAESDRRRDEGELRLRDRVIRAVSAGICISDPRQPDNPVIFVNPGFETMTGYSSAEVVGTNCRMLQGPETDRAQVQLMRDAVHEGRSCTTQLLNYRKDGSTFWNEITISPVVDDVGVLTHFVGMQTDVTERRELEAQMRQSQKMEAVGLLASGVAHDFNNVLTVIDMCSDLLARSLESDPDSLQLAVEIQRAGERAGTLTRQLLAFSRKQVVAPRIIDVNVLVEDSQRLLRRLIGEHIIVALTLSALKAPVLADPGQIEQVLINLVVNARDAMPNGGRLAISTATLLLHDVLGPLQPGPYVVLEVTDTGMGMSDAIIAQIFQPFFTTKPLGKGTGLGLATAQSIVEQAHGHVTVESVVGRGTTFRVYLPRDLTVVDASDDDLLRLHPGRMSRGTETILLVEDDDAVRSLGQRALEQCGYTVLAAADGYGALGFAREYPHRIHLLVSDVVMPHLGGRELAEQIGRILPDCRVMFVSGYTDDEQLLRGVVHSSVTMLQKPYTLLGLSQTVRRVLDGG